MKKVIIVFDGKHYSQSALEFGRVMNEMNSLLLTGVFTPNVSFSGSFVYPTEVPVAGGYPLLDEEEVEAMEKNVDRFDQFCQKHRIESRVHKDLSDFALPELQHESRFADLMLVDEESFFSDPEKQKISGLLREALHLAECPVVIVPKGFQKPEQIVLAYDGSEDAVYAIKQFSYLFPEFVSLPCLLVYVSPEPKTEMPDISNIEELAARHFSDLTIEKLEIVSKKYLATWLNARKGALLVTGSFRRSATSRLFRKSFITGVMEYGSNAIFLAHK